jgi:hypothetical protein
MTVDVFRAAAPAALATCTGIALAYFVYSQFIDKWYGESKKISLVEKIKFWLGVISCLAIAQGAMQISGELFYVAFNASTIRDENIYKGVPLLIGLPLILGIIGFVIGKLFKEQHNLNTSEIVATSITANNNKPLLIGIFVISAALFSITSIVPIFNSGNSTFDVYKVVDEKNCSSAYNDKPFIRVQYVVDEAKKTVVGKYEKLDGSNKKDIQALSDCTVIDKSNWTCGGKSSVIGSTYTTTDKTQMIDGDIYHKSGYLPGINWCPYLFK